MPRTSEIPRDIAGMCLPLYAGGEIPRDITGIKSCNLKDWLLAHGGFDGIGSANGWLCRE
jgi:hypothetical protein